MIKHLPNSWNTLAMRLAIRQSILLSILTLTSMFILYWLVSHFVLAQISSDLKYSLEQLSQIEAQQGSAGLVQRLDKLAIENESRGHSHRYFFYLSKDNTKLAGTLRKWPDEIETDGKVTNVFFDESALPTAWISVDEGLWPSVATSFKDGSKLLITQSIDSTEQLNDFTMFVMIFLVIAVTLISLLLGWLQGKTILKKINRINRTARLVEQGEMHQRVEIDTSRRIDEFDELGLHLNKMLNTTEKLMHDIKQVTQNIAHDLRKPLTRVQSKLESLQSQPPILPDSLDEPLADLANLNKTFNALLQLGRLESSKPQTKLENVELSELCNNFDSLYREMAENKSINWQSAIEHKLTIKGNRQLIAQAIINLLENALQYTPKNEYVMFILKRQGTAIHLTIENTGVTFTQNELQEIAKPFVRRDDSRTTQGNGLGLSLVKAILHTQDSQFSLHSNNNRFTAKAIFNIALPGEHT